MGTVTLRWVEDHLVVGTDSNGHSIAIGKHPGKAGEWAGMKPSDLLLLAAASCAAYDVISIMQKGREPLQDLKVYCSGEQEDRPPYTFTRIHLHYEASGPVRRERLERAVRLAEEKYCSVISTLRQGVPVVCDFEIKPGPGAGLPAERASEGGQGA